MLWARELVPERGEKRKMVYHDPCYLGRYQSVYDAPREVLKVLPGAELMEMKSHGPKSMCCGGGGGHYWMDLKRGERINNLRVKEAQAAGADTIVTGCAYCRQMLDDSVKATNLDEQLKVVDLVSLVLKSLPPDPEHPDRKTAADVDSPSDLSDTAPRVCG
jgi:Fe-S oxidoreductase